MTAKIRRLGTAVLALVIVMWAEAVLALVPGDQVLQCSMSPHEMQAMGKMPCCPTDEIQSPDSLPERPSCCSIGNLPEQPLNFVVSSKQVKFELLQMVTGFQVTSAMNAAAARLAWQDINSPLFIKPVLELKTDLRI